MPLWNATLWNETKFGKIMHLKKNKTLHPEKKHKFGQCEWSEFDFIQIIFSYKLSHANFLQIMTCMKPCSKPNHWIFAKKKGIRENEYHAELSRLPA